MPRGNYHPVDERQDQAKVNGIEIMQQHGHPTPTATATATTTATRTATPTPTPTSGTTGGLPCSVQYVVTNQWQGASGPA